MDKKQFEKNIATIIEMGKAANSLIHGSAMFALEQVNKHGNSNFANQLVSALSASMRKEALFVWFNDFGMVKRNKENLFEYAAKKKLSLDGEEISAVDILPIAEETPFYDYTKEIKPVSMYDVQKAVASIIKRASKFNKEGKQVEHAELLAKLSELLPVEA